MGLIKRGIDLEKHFKSRSFVIDSPSVRSERLSDGRVQLHAHKKAELRANGVPVTRRVLLWQIDSYGTPTTSLAECRDVYVSLGVPWSSNVNWSGNLSDYGLIIWPMAQNDPVWWSQLGTWVGRLHMTAEYDVFTDTRNYVNGRIAFHGMTVGNDHSEIVGGNEAAIPSSDPLAAGVNSLIHADTASVSGGQTIFTNIEVGPMMQHNQIGKVDWVVAGDSNHITDNVPGNATANTNFLANLINVLMRV
jgi:hypothetical protein